MIVFEEVNGIMIKQLRPDTLTYEHNYRIIDDFVRTKRLEGCTEATLKSYEDQLILFARGSNKFFDKMNAKDIRHYLYNYQFTRDLSNRSIDNIRRVFSSFFKFMQVEDYILKNPMIKIKKIKSEETLKEPFSDEEMVRLIDNCKNIREVSLIDFLSSTGVRVSELCKLNKDDIDFISREGIVHGKGKKDRMIFINASTKVHLLNYLDSRCDINSALFVSEQHPFDRLTKSGVEYCVRNIGDRAGIKHCHPHRFRRTFATRMISKGVPIEQVQYMLGHSKIDTTLIYAKVDEANVRFSHSKFA